MRCCIISLQYIINGWFCYEFFFNVIIISVQQIGAHCLVKLILFNMLKLMHDANNLYNRTCSRYTSILKVEMTKDYCIKIILTMSNIIGEPQTEEERQIRAKYDDWLHQMENWLQTNIHLLEQQVNKFRRTKKALNAKQRVVGVYLTFLFQTQLIRIWCDLSSFPSLHHNKQ